MVICLYQMWIIRRVVLFTICTTDSTTSGIYVHWPVTTMIIGATTATQTYLKILCAISIPSVTCAWKLLAFLFVIIVMVMTPPRFSFVFTSRAAAEAQTQEFAFCGSHLLPQECNALFFAQFPGTPDKSQIRILFSWVAFKTPWNNIFVRPKLLLLHGFKIPQNNQFRPPKTKLWAWKFKVRFELS